MRTLQIVAIAGVVAALAAAIVSITSGGIEVHDNMFAYVKDLRTAGRYAAIAAIANAVALAANIWQTRLK